MKNIILILGFTLFLLANVKAQKSLTQTFNLMPWPREITENGQKFILNSDFTLGEPKIASKRVSKAAVRFLRRLSNRTGVFLKNGFPVKNIALNPVSVSIEFEKEGKLKPGEDETYELRISEKSITINAVTDIGVLRALETLLQLVSADEGNFYFPGLLIKDAPRFVWRGLMIDAARHFMPVEVIKRNLDAMAAVKLNVFHWHLTDDQGFRVKSFRYPLLHLLASDGLYYTHEQIKEVVQYASDLGIRVLPEIDVPGHASAILTAYPEIGSKKDYPYAIERNSGIFDPTLDPTNPKTYQFLENLFTEITPLFPDEYFHIGGDENEGRHWDENKKIKKFKKDHNLKSNHDLQTHFNIKLEKILNKLGKKLMGWDEIMTPNMPTTAVIHSWRGENEGMPNGGSLIDAAKAGYKTILSNGYYIDRMLSVKHHYSVDPIGDIELTEAEQQRILGGEATMWSELVTPLTIDSRIWPRTAAIAERFWSEKKVKDFENMYQRLQIVSLRLEELGITHIKNQGSILRNISLGQDITSLRILAGVCEPLKIYSRNKGGTEYQTYSPFTLFADACVVDAADGFGFEKAVTNFLNDWNLNHRSAVVYYLDKWINGYASFEKLENNANLSPLKKRYKNLADLAKVLKQALLSAPLNKQSSKNAAELMKSLQEPFADVEIIIYKDLKKLLAYFSE